MNHYKKPDITAVLEAHGCERVPTSGGWRPVKCPYHDDRTASASVNIKLQAFNCHTCDASGGAWDLIMLHDNVTFKEALIIGDRLPPATHQPLSTRSRKREPLRSLW